MSTVLRALLIWLAVIAIPTQGITAATMVHCGPGKQGTVTMAGSMPSHAGHEGLRAAEESGPSVPAHAAHQAAPHAHAAHDPTAHGPAAHVPAAHEAMEHEHAAHGMAPNDVAATAHTLHASVQGPTGETDADGAAQAGLTKCSACAASCGIAVGLPPAIATVSVVAADEAQAEQPAALARGFLTDGPERPPRSLLA